MRFHDIFLAVIIILLFGACFMMSFLIIGFNNIKKNWPKYRCNPVMMPFASFFGHDTMKNFTQCVGKMQSTTTPAFTNPISGGMGISTQNMMSMGGGLQSFRGLTGEITPIHCWKLWRNHVSIY